MMSDTLDPPSTAMLLFDTLNGHLKTPGNPVLSEYRPQVENMRRLLRHARERGLMIAYAAANHFADARTATRLNTDTDFRLRPWGPGGPTNGPGHRPIVVGGTWETQIIDELAPTDDDYVIPKYRFSAFHGTYLDLALRTRQVRTIILVGGNTDSGVASTAFAARDFDYNLVIARDACTAHELDNHEQFMRRIFPRISRVRTTDEILKMLEPI